MPIETHNQIIKILADKTLQQEFSSQNLNKFGLPGEINIEV